MSAAAGFGRAGGFRAALLVLLPVLAAAHPAVAQVRLDGSLGPAGPVSGPSYRIGADLGQRRGDNLFHSFRRLDLRAGESVTFEGPAGIANVLARVTNGRSSTIDGTLRSEIPGASVFLLNPAGILFGAGARLEVGGSFHASTANHVALTDGHRFEARPVALAGLMTAAPAAFGFLGSRAAALLVHPGADLRVPAGRTLSLSGGRVEVTGGTLVASSGRISLAAVASPGEAALPGVKSAGFDTSGFATLGDVRLTGATLVASGAPGGTVAIRGGRLVMQGGFVLAETSGPADGAALGIDARVRDGFVQQDGLLATSASGAGRAGGIRIEARTVRIAGGAGLGSTTAGAGRAGTLVITGTESVTVTGTLGAFTVLFATTEPGSAGAAGRVDISAPDVTFDGAAVLLATSEGTGPGGRVSFDVGRLRLRDGAFVDAGHEGTGAGGSITVTARQSVELSGHLEGLPGIGSALRSSGGGPGPNGAVRVQAPLVSIDEGGIGTITRGSGRGGDVVVRGDRVVLTGGGRISTATSDAGQAGSLTVEGREVVSVSGQRTFFDVSSIDSAVGAGATGAGGPVTVRAPRVALDGRGVILGITQGGGSGSAVTIEADEVTLAGGSAIGTSTLGSGTGGGLTVRAGRMTVDDGQVRSTTFAGGEAGDVRLHLREALVVRGGGVVQSVADFGSTGRGGDIAIEAPVVAVDAARISADSRSVGRAGDVRLDVGSLTLTAGGQITTNALGAGDAGSLTVRASESVAISGVASPEEPSGLLSVSSAGARGRGGDIVVRTPRLTITAGGLITPGTVGRGDSGNVTVKAGAILIEGSADVILTGIVSGTASTTGGVGGRIAIEAGALTMRNRAVVSATTLGPGRAGDIRLDVGRLHVEDSSVITSSSFASGAAGSVRVRASEGIVLTGERREPVLVGRTRVAVGASIDSSTARTGAGGRVVVRTPGTFAASGPGSGLFTSARRGDAGSIHLSAGDVLLSGGAVISSRSTGPGDAGDIGVVAGTLRAVDSRITTQALAADGGNIDIRVDRLLDLRDSRITAAVGEGQGAGGNISIDPDFVVLRSSEIRADAFGGPGGNIAIAAGVFLASPDTVLDASSSLGAPGTVDVQAPITAASQASAPTPRGLAPPTALLRARCSGERTPGRASRFVALPREGLPGEPAGWLPGAPGEALAALPLPAAGPGDPGDLPPADPRRLPRSAIGLVRAGDCPR